MSSMRKYTILKEDFPLHTPFRIARGVKDKAQSIRVVIEQDGLIAQGESIPYLRYDETQDSVEAEIEAVRQTLESGATRDDLLSLLPGGAARNAVDCALWDLECKTSGETIFELLGIQDPGFLETSKTISIDTPEKMAEFAVQNVDTSALKVKLGNNDDDLLRMQKIHGARPDAELVVDANEGWDFEQMSALVPQFKTLGVTMIEQPLHSNKDSALEDYKCPIMLCADESLHTVDDLEQIARRYQMVNIKLDKTGGLTHALELKARAREMGLKIMVGCMVCSSLSIMPAYVLALDADFNDLEGPVWLSNDREGAALYKDGGMVPGKVWGCP